MTVGQLFEHVFALSLQLFDSFAEDALFGLWEFLTLFYSFFTLKQINMNIVARSLPFIFIFYLSWNFIYVRWTGSSHSLDTLMFTVWFTQLIQVCCCCLWVGEGQAKLTGQAQLRLDKLDNTACDWSHVTSSHLKQLLTRNWFVVCIANIFKQIVK